MDAINKKNKAPQIEDMIVSKENFIKSIPNFINTHKRLPYMKEDDVLVDVDTETTDEEGNIITKVEQRSYTAMKYVRGHFGDIDNLINELFDRKALSFKTISDIIGITPKRLESLMQGEAKKVETRERRAIHLFFGKDYYEDLGQYNDTHCEDCTKKAKCGQDYWVSVISCGKFSKSKAKKKKK